MLSQHRDDGVAKRYPIWTYHRISRRQEVSRHCTHPEMGWVFSLQPMPWIKMVVWTANNPFTVGIPWNEVSFEKVTLIFYRIANILKRYIRCDSPKQGGTSGDEALIQGVITFAVQRFIFDDWDIANRVNSVCNFPVLCPWIASPQIVKPLQLQ